MDGIAWILAIELVVLTAAFVLLWVVGTLRRNVALVDPFWGAGFVIVTWVARRLIVTSTPRGDLLAVLVTVWGIRLSLYLLWRTCGAGEDRRYAAIRRRHGARFWLVSLLSVFLLQAIILWFVALPIQVAIALRLPSALGWLDGLGSALWFVGLLFEAVGDWQLARFQAEPTNAGRVMDGGLWRFTRHPNYFGDFCVWWGLYLIAAAGGAWWTIGSPLLMSFLLLKVSGVPLLEGDIATRRPGYAAYQRRTNAFFPGPTKRQAN